MGAVYKALHTRLARLVALKVLPGGLGNNPDDLAQFEREMRAVGKLNHPNIEDPKKLKSLFEGNPMLRKLGVGPLVNGGNIKRDVWSSLEFTTSLFHNVARELGLGTPHVSC